MRTVSGVSRDQKQRLRENFGTHILRREISVFKKGKAMINKKPPCLLVVSVIASREMPYPLEEGKEGESVHSYATVCARVKFCSNGLQSDGGSKIRLNLIILIRINYKKQSMFT